MPSRTYALIDSRAVSTAITVLELTAPSTMALEITRAWMTQYSSATSAQMDVVLLRKAATITGTSITPVPLSPGLAATSATAKRTATAEGTDGDILAGDGVNVLTGWLWLPTPEERIIVPPSGRIAIKCPSAPPSATYRYGMYYREIG